MLSKEYTFEKNGSKVFRVGGEEGKEGKLWRVADIGELEIVTRNGAIRSIWLNEDDYEGSKSKRNCECCRLKLQKGEYIKEIIMRVLYRKPKSKMKLTVHYIEFITNYKRKAIGGTFDIDKKRSETFTVKGRISTFQAFFKGTGGILIAMQIQLSNPLEEKEISHEEEERLAFVVENLSDYSLTLANKDLNLWKSLTLRNDCSINEDTLKTLSLDVDEYTILCFLLGKKKVKVDRLALIDYYILFLHLGLKAEMCFVLELLEEHSEFQDLYGVFRKCLPYEPTIEHEWFKSTSEEEQKSLVFETAFCAKVYNLMSARKYRIEEHEFSSKLLVGIETVKDKEGNDIVVDDNIKALVQLLNHKSDLECIQGHKDIAFGDNDGDEEVYIRKSSRLRESHNQDLFKGKNANVILVTSDGEETKCHLELLIAHFEFFFRMVQFGGSEFSDLKEKGSMTLVDLKKDGLMVLVNYCYLKRLETESDIGVLISVFAHCEKYTEYEVEENIIKEITGQVSGIGREGMEKILSRVCKVMEMEHMRMKLLPILTSSGIEEKELLRMLEKELRLRNLEEKIEALEAKCKKLRKKNKKLKKKLKD